MRSRLAWSLVVFAFVAGAPATVFAPASAAKQRGCYAEVWYTNQTHGHTYEYRCGNLRLRAGEIVRVPVRNYETTARIVRISAYRTYFGGPLKTVRAIVSR